MDINENFLLWQFDELKKINDNTELVINKSTEQLMIKKIMHESEYEIHKELCSIRHRNLLRIYDVISDSGICTVLEEYINGSTLSQYCERYQLSNMQIVDIVLQLCSGLSVLHEKNIIHRDITPTNVMIDNYGTVKIIDFDISRITNDTSRHDTHILGTEGFAAPEQYGFRQSGPQTDIYAVGALINYMKKGKTLDEEQLDDESCLTDIMKKCIEFDPEKRYENINLLIDDLEKYRAYPDKRIKSAKGKRDLLISRLILGLPGIKSKKTSRKVFAITCYILFIIYVYSIFSQPENTSRFYQGIVIQVFDIIIPFFCFSNYLSFQEKIFTNYSISSKRTAFRLLGAISIVVGSFLSSMIK